MDLRAARRPRDAPIYTMNFDETLRSASAASREAVLSRAAYMINADHADHIAHFYVDGRR